MSIKYDPQAMRDRLNRILDEKRISMRKASLDAGFGETYVHGIIKLGRDPGILNLTTLCDSLDVSISYVLFGHDLSADEEEILLLFQENPARREAILELLRP